MLTGAAGELGPFPNPILTAADDGGAARGEAVAAVVASDGADLVALLWFAEGEGVADGGRGSALHCGVGGEGGRPGAAPNPSASPAAPTPAPGELRAVRTLFSLLWGGGGAWLTQPHFAGVGEVIIAGDITPLSPVVPHNDHAVLTGEKVAVGLPRVPIFIELGSTGRAGASLALCIASVPWCPISVLLVQAPRITRCSCQWFQLRLQNLGPIPRDGEGPQGVVGMGTG